MTFVRTEGQPVEPSGRLGRHLLHLGVRGLLGLIVGFVGPQSAQATDYFLTLGGGYSPAGNQASLEANVLFFREVLAEEHQADRASAILFADGYDDQPDLQVLAAKPDTSETPATDLLSRIYSFRPAREQVEYRNHRVPGIAGPLRPDSIRSALLRFAGRMRQGDRLFVYVTAHGGSAPRREPYNTSITCWDKAAVSAREFTGWLEEVPVEVPVVLVMAQCYCGGFAHAIFDGADREQGLAEHVRIGFFAQQHDLAAAGCRPDVDNDEEYSSFFWGALVGRSRTNKPIREADTNGDGRVSFAEAHARALIQSETIDIPLTASETLLRTYSRIGGYDHRRHPDSDGERPDEDSPPISLARMEGTLESLIGSARAEQQTVVRALVDRLGLSMGQDVVQVYEAYNDYRRRTGRGRRGRRRGSSGRRDLWTEIGERWPELGDRDEWRKSDLLRPENQQPLFDQLVQLENFQRFDSAWKRRQELSEEADHAEIQRVKYQRLVNTLEAIVLARNLSAVAETSVVRRYRAMIELEDSFLGSRPRPTVPVN